MFKIGDLIQTLKGLVETKVDIVKQEVQEEFIKVLSRILVLILMGGCLLLVLLFMSLALAFYISQQLESPYLGFVIVGLIYFLLLCFLLITRENKSLQKKTSDTLSNFIFTVKFFKKNNNE
ncbi:phage holin family protein [Algoriphagus halophytocola]|uniref:Phage holin family protein n=1 Tax=Algoriphagus halophytocola TaxID=2991499 RepID=A0ABY6MCV7_9BACT|nr:MULTISPECIES: phage holin family protein [unclassified Algoriphagus]UZD21333.1 phage holin family protein [Algoriphagus sp. TR-M5]WBL42544.1 phage holin family protein [Algoriphagus sp. TR-M9]